MRLAWRLPSAPLAVGDVTLDESWRRLSSIEAANGIIMFGWTTAYSVYVVQQLRTRSDKIDRIPDE